MSGRSEELVLLVETRTGFEAETIAAALNDRGVLARVMGATTAELWSSSFGGAQVMVRADEIDRATRELAQIRRDARQAADDQWEAFDDADDDTPLRDPQLRRGYWTLLLLFMVPTGLWLLSRGTMQQNPYVKILGGVLLISAGVIFYAAIRGAKGRV